MTMIIELMLAEFDREMVGTRRSLERVPEGQNEWKPHEKSMPLGYLAGLIATMPRWIVSIVVEDGLDLASPGQYCSRAFDTGYLRLNGKPVPALYGPSADEAPF